VESGKNPEVAIKKVYQQLLLLPISDSKKKSMMQLFATAKLEFEKAPKARAAFFQGADAGLAALAVTTNAMMNLDEFLTKP
jgi:hypothetical protein